MNTNCGLNENGALVKDAVDMIGEIKILAQSAIPSNCLPCNGAAISRAAYPELFAAIGTTYGAGDGSTTFNIPDAEGVLYGNQGRTVGAAVADGLPNITGQTGVRPAKETSKSSTETIYTTVEESVNQGVFLGSGGTAGAVVWTFALGIGDTFSDGQFHFPSSPIKFDASKSNSIYGASTHVQPQGITFNVVIVFE